MIAAGAAIAFGGKYRIGAALKNLANGKANKEDVDRLSLWFKETVETSWRPEDKDDKEFQLHLSYVFWQILQWLRYEGLSQNAVEGIGRLLRRLFLVYQAYRTKKRMFTPVEWLGHLLSIYNESTNVVK